MVRITACLVSGVLTGIHAPAISSYNLTIVSCTLLAVFASSVLLKVRLLAGISGLSLITALGYWLVVERTPALEKDDITNVNEEIISYRLVISTFAETRPNSLRTRGELQAVKTLSGWRIATGTLLIYVPRKDSVEYHYGDVLLIDGRPTRIPPATNPGQFDFRQYMAYKGVYFQDVLRRERVKIIGSQPPNMFLSYAINVRQWADNKIKSVVKGDRERATASALVLGVTDGLDNELLQAYASTGALHVLAVSGLHVSIIYWILLALLKPLNRTTSSKWALAFISVFVLWSYAFVSGWSPSVLRAVTMFSFVAFARPWRQSTNIFNTLASSMFCLLLYDPYYIMSVGFQLSYLAVFGIVFLQPRLYPLWEPKSLVLDEIWKVSSVSIAAQIATLPIGLLYFHQFPTYFLPANLAVIPISFVVLVLGLAISALAFFEPLIQVLGWLLMWTVKLMNEIVILFEGLPFSVIEGIYITPLQCLLLGAVITSMVLLFIQKEIAWLYTSMIVAMVFSLTHWDRQLTIDHNEVLRVYNVKNLSLIEYVRGNSSVLVLDSLPSGDNYIHNQLQSAWLRDGVSNTATLPRERTVQRSGCRLWMWGGVTMLQVIASDHELPQACIDVVLISNNSLKSLSDLSQVKCEKIIVDSSNSFYFAERLRLEAKQMGLPLWSVLHDGAFEYKDASR